MQMILRRSRESKRSRIWGRKEGVVSGRWKREEEIVWEGLGIWRERKRGKLKGKGIPEGPGKRSMTWMGQALWMSDGEGNGDGDGYESEKREEGSNERVLDTPPGRKTPRK